ncbi:unnamed protein product [Cylicocyclus nassatus]|uniref:DNA2/NAM7 helicase-like C-terminal domain-containing protein n=1 Tax=Cylicocyclus nassatus TaxID=53992 RepID=A0AA36M7W0_CYLNA|nr:unnamed protein product [Cylicocyclus nassatus]
MTASTNAAVAQFAETLLSLDNQSHLAVVRYRSDTAAAENNSPTSADLGELLKKLGSRYAEQLTADELDLCSAFQSGREVLKRYLDDPDLVFRMTGEDREEHFISERFVSRNVHKMVDLLFRLMKPNVILATTSSTLNVSGPGGIFRKHMEGFKVLIGDEVSQIPEPVLMALAVRLPARRHVYIFAEFLDDYRRMNVAFSRCRHGQFILLGHVRMLQKIPYSNRVFSWSTSIRAIVSRSDLGRAWPIRVGCGKKLQCPVTDRRRLSSDIPGLLLAPSSSSALQPTRIQAHRAAGRLL